MNRRLLIVAGALLLLFALLGAGAFWLGGREGTLRWLAEQAVQRSGGALQLSGVGGSLYKDITISRVVYRDARRELELRDVALTWSPRALLEREIVIDALRFGSIALELRAADDEPPTLPESLAAPLKLTLRELTIGEFAFIRPGFQTRLRNVALTLEGGRESWQGRLTSLNSEWGDALAVFSVGGRQPFPLQGNVQIARFDAPGYAATVALRGSLAELAATVTAKAHGAAVNADLALAPFGATPLTQIDLAATDINLPAFREGLPAATLELQLNARGLTGEKYAGEISIRNSDPGKVDQHKVPMREIKTGFSGSAAALELPALSIDLGDGGRFYGNGAWRDNQFALTLNTESLNLRGVHAKLNQTQLAGAIALAASAKSQTVRADLRQDRYRFIVDAALADQIVKLRELVARAGEGLLAANGELALNGNRSFTLNGELKRFDPAQFGDYPKAIINSSFRASGAIEPDLQLAGDLKIVDSSIFGEPLSASAKLATSDRTIKGSDIVINLGKSRIEFDGSFTAAGDQAFRAKGALTRVNPAHFGDYPRGLINSRFDLAGALQPQWKVAGDLNVYDSRLFDQPLSARAKLATSGETIAGENVVVNLGKSKIELDGSVATTSDHAFRLKGKVARINPEQIGALRGSGSGYPRGLINGDFTANGKISPEPAVKATFSIYDSTIIDQKLGAKGIFQATPERIAGADITIDAGGNRLKLDGAFGAPRDVLAWNIAAPQLATFGKDFAGSLNAAGSLGGTFKAPAFEFKASAEKLLLFGDYRIARFSGAGKFDAGFKGALAADAEAAGIVTPQLDLNKATLALSGAAADHRLVVSAANTDVDLDATLNGAWSDTAGWRGQITNLVNRGPYPARLRAPAALAFGNEQFSLRDATVIFADGLFNVEALEKKGGRLASRGSASRFPVGYLLAFANEGLPLTSSLLLGANWDVVADRSVNGKLRIWREQGDLTVLGEPRINLDLGRLDLNANIASNQVDVNLAAASGPLGALNANATTSLSERNGAWGIAGSTPISLQAEGSVPSLSWLQPFVKQPGFAVDGALALKLAADGTLAAPHLTGTVNGDRLVLQLPQHGLNIENGSLRAEFAGQQLLIKQLLLRTGEGRLQAEGAAAWRDGKPSIKLAAQMEKFQALDSRERQLAVSGSATVALNERKLELDAKLIADRGLIVLPKQDAPTLSNDVVIVGGQFEIETYKPEQPLTADVDVRFDLGDDFRLRGKGIEAHLTGAVHVTVLPGKTPMATGKIQATGTYEAYNQQLTIERGVLTFTGPIDNPALDILAVRKVPELDSEAVEAGVAVTGSAIAPQAKLVSTPDVPDAEKLSWLVSGHGSDGTGGADVLAVAAGGFLSGDGPTLQSQVAAATGLDEVAVRSSGGIEKSVLALGKRLSSRVYVNYEQSLTGAASLVKINYALTPRWSVRGTAGGDNAVDLFYSFSFD